MNAKTDLGAMGAVAPPHAISYLCDYNMKQKLNLKGCKYKMAHKTDLGYLPLAFLYLQ